MATSKSVYVNKAAYIYLQNESREQRGFAPLSEAGQTKVWERIPKGPDFMAQIINGDIGGGNGTQDYHKWTSWSVETVKGILRGAGFEDGADYWDGPAVEYINI